MRNEHEPDRHTVKFPPTYSEVELSSPLTLISTNH